jgi:excinuclease UvrABC nuclease subunit
MTDSLLCYRCGTSLADLSLPLTRLDECPDCTMQLHVCRMCVYYDPNVARQCREDDAEEVHEKARANFCDFFKPRGDAFTGQELTAEMQAKNQFAALFGNEDGSTADKPEAGASAADDLFK